MGTTGAARVIGPRRFAMEIRYALAELVQKFIHLILDNAGIGFIALPLLTLRWVMRFLRWGVATAKGGDDLEEMQTEFWHQREQGLQLRQRARDTFRRRY